MRKIIFFISIVMLMCACNHNRSKQVNQKDVVSESEKLKTKSDKEAGSDSDMKSEKNNSDVAGTYVTESYKLRSEGYDWVAVSIKGAQDRMIDIAIRSRDDKKKPTCTFDGTGKEIQPDLYEAEYEGKKILFAFTDSTLYISAKNKDEENILYFFCSGGASLKGEYYKLNEAIDKK